MRKMKNAAVELKRTGPQPAQEYSGIENYDTIYEISNTNTQIKIVANENANRPDHGFNSADKSSIDNILSNNNGNMQLYFSDTLQVIYSKAIPPFEYGKYAGNSYNANIIVSELLLTRPGPVTIMPNGSFEPTNLAMNGFWGWWEKISIMLPYDYQPFDR